jgi:hypothetical protein
MSEIKLTLGEEGQAPTKKESPWTWRRWLVGIGVFLLFAGLFASAAAKGALGSWPLYISLLAFVLFAIAGIAELIKYLASKGKGA